MGGNVVSKANKAAVVARPKDTNRTFHVRLINNEEIGILELLLL